MRSGGRRRAVGVAYRARRCCCHLQFLIAARRPLLHPMPTVWRSGYYQFRVLIVVVTLIVIVVMMDVILLLLFLYAVLMTIATTMLWLLL